VRYRGEEVRLTPKEFELFRYLVERRGRVVTRERLVSEVWGYDADVETRSIDAHIRRLRLKLGPARDHIETIVGLGYRVVARQPARVPTETSVGFGSRFVPVPPAASA